MFGDHSHRLEIDGVNMFGETSCEVSKADDVTTTLRSEGHRYRRVSYHAGQLLMNRHLFWRFYERSYRNAHTSRVVTPRRHDLFLAE